MAIIAKIVTANGKVENIKLPDNTTDADIDVPGRGMFTIITPSYQGVAVFWKADVGDILILAQLPPRRIPPSPRKSCDIPDALAIMIAKEMREHGRLMHLP